MTVVGLGLMGTALAEAFIIAGHPTTVWNRTASKASPLAAKGANAAATIEDAVAASPLIVTCLTTFEDTRSALAPVSVADWDARALVTLNSGNPADAREMAAWADDHGARFLAGAVKNVPAAVGLPDTLLYYSGDQSVFDDYEKTLTVLGGDTVFLGEDPDLAALYEMAVGGTLLPTLVGFYQGAATLQSRGLQVSSMVRFSAKWLDMISSLLPIFAKEIDTGDYSQPLSTVDTFIAGAAHDASLGAEADIDIAWHAPLNDLLRRAADAGHGGDSISVLTEVLKGAEFGADK
ncbi:NAD(P)-dependent oxidoreductase [Agromyces subbeticus]|uniref:NAD(P)-dependent oxidoreductase n=1 Tax=Agromyces subbeticus TaxID=293890 RepID=UPI00040AE9B1|nr:NAD(P)-binding domain-containing protein [Agromyces subbeticus]